MEEAAITGHPAYKKCCLFVPHCRESIYSLHDYCMFRHMLNAVSVCINGEVIRTILPKEQLRLYIFSYDSRNVHFSRVSVIAKFSSFFKWNSENCQLRNHKGPKGFSVAGRFRLIQVLLSIDHRNSTRTVNIFPPKKNFLYTKVLFLTGFTVSVTE